MGDEESEENDGHPKFFQCNLANFRFVGWEVVRERGGPDLGAKVAGRADEETGQDQSLCEMLANLLAAFATVTYQSGR